jgi:predicted peptidase
VTIRKKLFFFCILFSLYITSSSVNAQFDVQTFNFETDSMPYLLLKPLNFDSSKSYPLILFLHGSGERGHDNKRTVTHIESLLTADSNRIVFPAFVLVPQCDTGHRWVEVDWKALSHTQPTEPSKYMRLSIELLHEIESRFPIDPKRIYVTGLSMGGFGTWDIIARLPNKFAAAAPVCGGGDIETAAVIKNIPIWIFHGSTDKVVKASRSNDMYEALKKVDGDVKYSEYQEVGHDSWKPAYREPDFLKWMFGQRKG